jgi:hypothetical protein
MTHDIKVAIDFNVYNDVLGKTGKKLYTHQEEGIKIFIN